jgi:Flp pilus assembly CpaF family ATPase
VDTTRRQNTSRCNREIQKQLSARTGSWILWIAWGTISTLHANSTLQGISGFASCVLQSGVEIPYLAIKTNIADSLNVIVQIERRPGIRFVSGVLEIRGFDIESETYQFESVYSRKD